MAGSAVSDVIHLIAELVENATAFSPPNTRIEVRAERVGTGLVAEIEDRGLGLSPDELADINARLASPPEFDLAHSDQLGLFVVSQLAARHAIKVSLRRSVYGGTTAVVLMPFGVIVREEEARPRGSAGGDRAAPRAGPRSLTGRHRLPARPPACRGRGRAAAFGLRDGGSAGPRVPGPNGTGRRTGPRPPSVARDDRSRARRNRAARGQPGARALGRRRCRRLRAPPRRRPSAAPAAARQPAAPAPSGSHLGMPIRVPQASMAPQLRDRAARTRRPAARGPQAADGARIGARSPGGDPQHADHDAAGVAARAGGRSRRPRGRAGYGGTDR